MIYVVFLSTAKWTFPYSFLKIIENHVSPLQSNDYQSNARALQEFFS